MEYIIIKNVIFPFYFNALISKHIQHYSSGKSILCKNVTTLKQFKRKFYAISGYLNVTEMLFYTNDRLQKPFYEFL